MSVLATLSEVIDQAVDDGYASTFLAERGGLRCVETGERFRPEQTHIVRHERFEGHSSQDDQEVLYYIETSTGPRGTLADAYGTYASEAVAEFLGSMRVEQKYLTN